MKLSQLAINSVSLRGTLEEKIAGSAAAGFRAIEFSLGDVKNYLKQDHTIDDVRALLLKHDMVCIGGFEVGIEAFGSDEERSTNRQRLVENARLLSSLGAGSMVVGTDGPREGNPGASAIIAKLAEAFAEIGPDIAAEGITLCIEFNWSPVVKSLRTAAEIARRANQISGLQSTAVLFDPAHYHCTPTKFEQLTRENVAVIGHVHVDDMRDIPGELSNCNSDRALPGEGCLDLGALFGAIEDGGYEGWFSIEMFSDELWALPAQEAAEKMYASLVPLCK